MSDGAIRFTAKLKGAFTVARLLRRYPEKVSRTLLSLVKQEARGLSVELARNTRPFGFSEKARKTGEKAVAKDIGGVFALPSDAFEEIRKSDPAAADRFWANIQNRRFSRAENNLRQTRSGWKDLTVGRHGIGLANLPEGIRRQREHAADVLGDGFLTALLRLLGKPEGLGVAGEFHR